jgi:hypothetical protein
LISDFIDTGFEDAIQIANRKHDLIALRIFDKRETELPDIGLLKVKNAETGKQMWIDTSDAKLRRAFYNKTDQHEKYLTQMFLKGGIDNASIATDQDYVKPLVSLFKKREGRR